jgi:ketosteroid isomerase-like protein
MSQENVDSVKRGFEAWNRDDFGTWIVQFAPEVEWSALTEEYQGHDGARQAWESFKGVVNLTVRFDDIRDLGESVLALGEITGTGRTTGLHVGGELAQLFMFRDGKIVRVRDFRSHAEALEAVRLSEQDAHADS